jgi:hypothetical protein
VIRDPAPARPKSQGAGDANRYAQMLQLIPVNKLN